MFKTGFKKQFGKFSNTVTFAQIFLNQFATLCCILTLIIENRYTMFWTLELASYLEDAPGQLLRTS